MPLWLKKEEAALDSAERQSAERGEADSVPGTESMFCVASRSTSTGVRDSLTAYEASTLAKLDLPQSDGPTSRTLGPSAASPPLVAAAAPLCGLVGDNEPSASSRMASN